jgi:hypothetical protein
LLLRECLRCHEKKARQHEEQSFSHKTRTGGRNGCTSCGGR